MKYKFIVTIAESKVYEVEAESGKEALIAAESADFNGYHEGVEDVGIGAKTYTVQLQREGS